MAGAAAEQRRLATVVESWLGRPVLVVGDAMLDEWRFADSDRLCREAPAPVLTLRRRISAAGGAANTAVNVAALGGRAVLVAPVGADVAGDELHDCLDRAGVWDRTVNQPGRPTPVKRRMLAGNQILLREDSGDPDDALDPDGVARLLTALDCATEELRAAADGEAPTLVVCDYGLGALPAPVRAWLVEQRERYATVALDAHDLADWRGLAPTVVTPSFAEATRLLARAGGAPRPTAGTELHLEHLDSDPADGPSELSVGAAPGGARADDRPGPVGEPTRGEGQVALTGDGLSVTGTGVTVNTEAGAGVDRAVLAESRLAELRAHTGADVVAVTLDTEGAVVGGADGEPRRSHSTPVPASHAVGAGDAYLAAMTLALAADAPLPTAAQLAQLAATITVSDTGTCVCLREDLLAALDMPPEAAGHPALVGTEELDAIVAEHRDAGRSVVFAEPSSSSSSSSAPDVAGHLIGAPARFASLGRTIGITVDAGSGQRGEPDLVGAVIGRAVGFAVLVVFLAVIAAVSGAIWLRHAQGSRICICICIRCSWLFAVAVSLDFRLLGSAASSPWSSGVSSRRRLKEARGLPPVPLRRLPRPVPLRSAAAGPAAWARAPCQG